MLQKTARITRDNNLFFQKKSQKFLWKEADRVWKCFHLLVLWFPNVLKIRAQSFQSNQWLFRESADHNFRPNFVVLSAANFLFHRNLSGITIYVSRLIDNIGIAFGEEWPVRVSRQLNSHPPERSLASKLSLQRPSWVTGADRETISTVLYLFDWQKKYFSWRLLDQFVFYQNQYLE